MSNYCCIRSDVHELVWVIRTGTTVCWNKNVISYDYSKVVYNLVQ